MMRRKNIIKFWSIFAVVLVLALLAITVAYKWHSIFPDGRVSQLYIKSSNVEGLSASFVEGYRVNDTLSLDVTLLETRDSVAWKWVCDELNIMTLDDIPPELRANFFKPQSFEYFYMPPDSTLLAANYNDLTDTSSEMYKDIKDVCVFTRYDMTACVFHVCNDSRRKAIVSKKTDEITW